MQHKENDTKIFITGDVIVTCPIGDLHCVLGKTFFFDVTRKLILRGLNSVHTGRQRGKNY